jgi:hypothetical protein
VLASQHQQSDKEGLPAIAPDGDADVAVSAPALAEGADGQLGLDRLATAGRRGDRALCTAMD